jgi:hypothetical protein
MQNCGIAQVDDNNLGLLVFILYGSAAKRGL